MAKMLLITSIVGMSFCAVCTFIELPAISRNYIHRKRLNATVATQHNSTSTQYMGKNVLGVPNFSINSQSHENYNEIQANQIKITHTTKSTHTSAEQGTVP